MSISIYLFLFNFIQQTSQRERVGLLNRGSLLQNVFMINIHLQKKKKKKKIIVV
jgi:hypothetical protein